MRVAGGISKTAFINQTWLAWWRHLSNSQLRSHAPNHVDQLVSLQSPLNSGAMHRTMSTSWSRHSHLSTEEPCTEPCQPAGLATVTSQLRSHAPNHVNQLVSPQSPLNWGAMYRTISTSWSRQSPKRFIVQIRKTLLSRTQQLLRTHW